MPEAFYISLSEINELQTNIMLFVSYWVKKKKTPVPQKDIILRMQANGIKNFTTVNALNSLLRKGYIRRAYTISNKTTYVQLRGI
jgi:hypothetical protein